MKDLPAITVSNRTAHPRVPDVHPATHWGSEVKRILCVRLDNLGDILMTTPALHALRGTTPGRHLTLLASTAGSAIAPLLPDVDEVIRYDAPWVKHPPCLGSDTPIWEMLAAGRFDAAVIFTVYSQNPLPAAMLCHLAGIPRRLAHCRENPYALLTHWAPETEPECGTRHEVLRQLALVERVGAHVDDARMHLVVPAADAATVEVKLAARGIDIDVPLLVVHPGATAPSRRYPVERFAQAAEHIIESLGCTVIVTGDESERPLGDQFQRTCPRAHNFIGLLSLAELCALIKGAQVLVSNNSGPVHIASALCTPVVDLYALTNPQHGPWQTPHRLLFEDVECRWCYRSVCTEGHHRCLTGVSFEAVVDAVHALWSQSQRRRPAAQPAGLVLSPPHPL
ncbi:glycosyltransferase family 9 protein [Pararobbsia alpina]|uniref:ADP-heptose--LPS heptosyltransferase 2 n=1 Tax=Pararobbsia alpina TaxID=621374 RepID=A0A6S7DB91_9BURK|nr:glycosyltransferase family 9 protein [Pararobbsia alpina]CAB3800691.1 ADP-heptose--LPS heptosyltransferase 2 [Pararobbsia alpina]